MKFAPQQTCSRMMRMLDSEVGQALAQFHQAAVFSMAMTASWRPKGRNVAR
jgi:hypothetical protein